MARRGVADPRHAASEHEPEISRLYGLPLDQFTAARKELAARLKKAGQADEAEAVKALQEADPPLWAVNQVARQHPEAIRDFLKAIAHLRATQERRRSDELDEATRQERQTFGRLAELVRHQLSEAGSRDAPDTMARVTATLRGAAADPSRHNDLRHGALKEGSSSSRVGAFEHI
jgi:hypothetical protein